MNKAISGAHFDETGTTVIIESLVIEETDVSREARHWITGERGPSTDDPAALSGADLTKFATEALVLGAKALTLTAETTETRALERMLKDVVRRTSEATHQASEATAVATKSASETMVRAATDAKKAIADADEATRKRFTEAVDATKKELAAETRRLFGGENPELLERLQPVLDKFGMALEKQVQDGTSELLMTAAKQLDPSDPTSPMARHAKSLAEQQERFSERIEEGQIAMRAELKELSDLVKVQEARFRVSKLTPIKGGTFEQQVQALMGDIAAGLGDEYEDTTTRTGLVPRCKKGDGVLDISGQDARVVVEVTDSARNGWGDYFDEAERNRGAAAALGVVRDPEQNGGRTIRVMGQRRVVIAFNPDQDDPELLRTVLLLLRTAAMAAAVRTGEAEIDTAEEKIAEAIIELDKMEQIKKAARSIEKGATKIENECATIDTVIRRLLEQAATALSGSQLAVTETRPAAVSGAA